MLFRGGWAFDADMREFDEKTGPVEGKMAVGNAPDGALGSNVGLQLRAVRRVAERTAFEEDGARATEDTSQKGGLFTHSSARIERLRIREA